MSDIRILDPFTANQIAAGEVVERPASVVKELCENALDAGASSIFISIQNGGVLSIIVTDNGKGMDREDAKNAFARHATSKLNTIQDFDSIKTMGFRGEALASIAAVSKVTLKTKQAGVSEGTLVKIEDGGIVEHSPAGCAEGTNISVEYLFYNTPARYKFLKKDSTESSYITDIIERFIIARPDVSFRFFTNDKEILHSPGNNDLKSAIFSIYGKDVIKSLLPLSYETEKIKITGFIGKPELARNSRQQQSIFVNDRYIKSKIICAAIDEGYKTLLMKGRFSFGIYNITISPVFIDVNVHPQKTEIKFWNDQEVFVTVLSAIKKALESEITIPEIKHEIKNSAEANPENVQTKNHEQIRIDIENNIKPQYENLNSSENNILHLNEDNSPSNEYIIPLKEDDIPMKEENIALKEDNIPQSVKINELAHARFIGSLFNTYLLMEIDDNLILIDQHAAHERILFETLVNKYNKKIHIAQPLLTPVIMDLTAKEIISVNENIEFLSQIGFECEIFGSQSVVIRTVPFNITDLDIENAIKSVLDMLADVIQPGENRINEAFYSIACKAAVKAKDALDEMEIKHLLNELQKIPNPTHCPHGRPVLIKLSRYEIEKIFKRVVS